SNNDVYNLFNPTLNSGMTVTLTQPLLEGFGTGVNGRNLVLARNNREISDIAFRHQVEATVTQIEEIYWDTVSARDMVQVAEQSLSMAKTILQDDQRQLQIGTMIPLNVMQQQSVVAGDEQSLTAAQTNYEYQKLLLLNATTKNMTDPVLLNADVEPTDEIAVSPNEAIQPIQDLVHEALQHRPELAISRINMANQRISLKAVQNALLPSLNLNASYGSNALAGVAVPPQSLPPFFGGGTTKFVAGSSGFGSNMSSVIQGNYPTYAVGLTLKIPIRNRSAQADAIRAQLEMRQSEAQYQQSINEIVLEVRNAQFALQQDRAAVAAAQEAVSLNTQTLAADRKRVALGAGVISTVITDQTNLTQARQTLVAAMSNYQIARVQLNQLIGRTLTSDRISIQDAENGHVTQMP
ncbi:MAG: TolC family protein, partial [Gammaproteobacteria bacterium]